MANARRRGIMKFRKMSEEMTGFEVEQALHIIFNYAVLIRYEMEKTSNYVKVYYVLPEYMGKGVHRLDLLPDDVYVIGDNEKLDGEPIEGEALWNYLQFTVAKGYSELWKENPYTRTQKNTPTISTIM